MDDETGTVEYERDEEPETYADDEEMERLTAAITIMMTLAHTA